MPQTSQVHVDTALTNVSTAYIQDTANFIADKVFPIVRVMKKSDEYFIYDKNDYFRDEAEQRAAGTESAGGDYDLSTGTYSAKTYAFHKDITNEERENSDPALDPDSDAAEYTTQKCLIRRERVWAANYFVINKWGTDVVGTTNFTKWDNATSDPIDDVETGKRTIMQNTGYEPNRLVLGYEVFSALKNHPLIVDRYKHTTADSITADMMARVFEVEQVIVAKGVYATNEEGGTEANSFILGKNALLVYAQPTPALKKPSGGYIFTWTGEAGTGTFGNLVRTYDLRGSGRLVDRVESEMRFDAKLVGSDLGYFFSAAVD
jgi:hypothetical protein